MSPAQCLARCAEIRAEVEALMAARAALPADGPFAWQHRETRRRLLAEIHVGIEDYLRFLESAKLANHFRKR